MSYVTNTIRLPSGDQVAAPWPPGGAPIWVSRRGAPPRADTIQIVEGGIALNPAWPKSAGASDWKVIHAPSGDHAGAAPNSTSCLATPPKDGTIQTPPRLRE